MAESGDKQVKEARWRKEERRSCCRERRQRQCLYSHLCRSVVSLQIFPWLQDRDPGRKAIPENRGAEPRLELEMCLVRKRLAAGQSWTGG